MTKYDKELQSNTDEFDEAIEPLEDEGRRIPHDDEDDDEAEEGESGD